MALTKSDKNFIGSLLNIKKLTSATRVVLEELIEEKGLITREDLKYLPSKEEYFAREDKMMGKLKKIEEEFTLLSNHSTGHTDRIEKLENIHPKGKHVATI